MTKVTQVNSGESGGKNRDSRNSGEKRDSDSVTEENSVYRSIQLKFRSCLIKKPIRIFTDIDYPVGIRFAPKLTQPSGYIHIGETVCVYFCLYVSLSSQKSGNVL